MVRQAHIASQYLAMAGKSFLEAKDDDSHTNIGFFVENQTLRTWDLDKTGLYLAFNYKDFSLEWVSNNKKSKLALQDKLHNDIVKWLKETAASFGLTTSYSYDLHYQLPYKQSQEFKFTSVDLAKLESLVSLRILANKVIDTFLNNENLKSTIRIWPHHFDTGAFVELNDGSGKSIGLGMAIPDSVCDAHYFYMSGYAGHNPINTTDFKKLSFGAWKNDSFKGAILNAVSANEESTISFLTEAFKAFKN